jgi:hypothetical protein
MTIIFFFFNFKVFFFNFFLKNNNNNFWGGWATPFGPYGGGHPPPFETGRTTPVAHGGGLATQGQNEKKKKIEGFALEVAKPPLGQMGWLATLLWPKKATPTNF